KTGISMPAFSAVSTRPVPLLMCTSSPSIVTRTSSGVLNVKLLVAVVLVDGGEEVRERRIGAERAAAVREMSAELVAELRHAAGEGHRRRVAEHAEALADDPVADVEHDLEVVLRGGPVLDRAQDLHEPARADAARRALAARLVHVELRDAERELDHAGSIVDRAHDAGADEEAVLAERVRVELRVELVRRHH